MRYEVRGTRKKEKRAGNEVSASILAPRSPVLDPRSFPMLSNPLKSSKGFTYLAALMLVMISGIMLAKAGQSWQVMMQREKEEELLFRGKQMGDAIRRWHEARLPGQHPRTPLNDLKHLLRDPRSAGTMRYLRRLYTDPISGQEWTLIKDPVWGIVGVASPSTREPLKRANFPDEFQDFEGKARYSDWVFRHQQAGAQKKQ